MCTKLNSEGAKAVMRVRLKGNWINGSFMGSVPEALCDSHVSVSAWPGLVWSLLGQGKGKAGRQSRQGKAKQSKGRAPRIGQGKASQVGPGSQGGRAERGVRWQVSALRVMSLDMEFLLSVC